METNPFFQGLIILGSLGFLIGVYYAYKLSKETKNEKYWLMLTASAVFLAIHQWVIIPWEFHILTNNVKFVIEQVSSIIGGILFAYAIYGLYNSMKKIRELME